MKNTKMFYQMISRVVFITIIVIIFSSNSSCFKRKSINSSRGGSCSSENLCCPGRDASCVIHSSVKVNLFTSNHARMNEQVKHQVHPSQMEASGEANNDSIQDNNVNDDDDDDDDDDNTIETEVDRTCYCDSACTSVGDCCHDYEKTCGAVDCVVSDWGQWSKCDVECGLGSMIRERKIITDSRNGGTPCPELTQKRGCHGVNCEISKAVYKASREAALILPSSYSTLRQYNASLDIRSNLRSRYPRDPRYDRSNEYCVVFEVTRARKGCELSDQKANHKLTSGSKVCVSCASAAMRKHLGYRCHGHGIDDTVTRFSSVASNNCHGQWKRRGQYELCPCHADSHADFIFI